jgi:hypothetical protein
MGLRLSQPRDDSKELSQGMVTTDFRPKFNNKNGTRNGTQISQSDTQMSVTGCDVSFSDVSGIERKNIKVVWQRRFITMTWLQE